MSAPQITPPGSTAASTPSGATGLVSLPSQIIRLPQELAARLLQGPRTVIVSGTVTGHGADGALQIRSQFGEIAVRTASSVPVDRQVSVQIPPLSGNAATLTPPQLTRQPIPASLVLDRPATASPDKPQARPVSAAAASTQPISGGSTTPPTPPNPPSAAAAGTAPEPSPAPATPGNSPSQGGAPAQPAAAVPRPVAAGSPTPQAGTPVDTGRAELAAPAPQLRPSQSPAAPSPTTSPASGAAQAPAKGAPGSPLAPQAPQSAPAPSPSPAPSTLGRLSLTAQILTQSSDGAGVSPPPARGSAPPGAGASPGAAAASPQVPTAGASARTTSSPPPAEAAGSGRIAPGATTARPAPAFTSREAVPDEIPIDSARRVPVLRETVSLLNAADPSLATQFVRSVLPQANTQLAATLLFFLSATRGGDIRGWMGERVSAALENAGRGDLVPKLSAELSAPARTAAEPPAADWRSQTIPLYQDGDVGGLTLHVRRSGDERGEPQDAEEKGHRFLLDVDLSRMGPMQLDGMIRERRFDLTVRSPLPLPEPIRQGMRDVFRDASDIVGLNGGLTFQPGEQSWIRVAAQRRGS